MKAGKRTTFVIGKSIEITVWCHISVFFFGGQGIFRVLKRALESSGGWVREMSAGALLI